MTRTKCENVTSFFLYAYLFSGQILNKRSSQMRLKQDSMLFTLVHTVLMGTQGYIIEPVRKSHWQ